MNRINISLFILFTFFLLSCSEDNNKNKLTEYQKNIGKCYINKISNTLVGEIIAIENNPLTQELCYRVQNYDNVNSKYYMGFDNCIIVDCNEAITKQKEIDNLIGKCAYNPSDMKYLGRVIRIGGEGIDSYGKSDPGQRAITVMTTDNITIDITYPKHLVIKDCETKK